MQISTITGPLESLTTDCLVITLPCHNKLSAEAAAIDKAMEGQLSDYIRTGELAAKLGSTLLLHHPKGLKAKRLLIVSGGDLRTLTAASYIDIVTAAATALKALPLKQITSTLHQSPIEQRSAKWAAQTEVQLLLNSHYQFTRCKSDPDHPPKIADSYQLHLPKPKQQPVIQRRIERGKAIAAGMALTRELADLPGNICTPTYLAEQAQRLAESYSPITCTILDEAKMEELGMGALLSVSRGSRQPAKLIVMEYRGGESEEAPVVLVGKGVTFDAGGISLKPGANMDEMKYDMCGGATVFGVMKAVAEMGLALNLVGVVPSCENLPDGQANKPGDIVTSLSGQTIEILNTDAEGRLILCDALSYSERFKPAAIIDIATLTGACIVALGSHASALMGNDERLIEELRQAGDKAHDRLWPLPLWEEYDKQLKSPFADMANIGGPKAGTITAGCFLARFTKKMRWAHLDIAGTSWLSGDNKGATGRPVPLLVNYLLQR
ncbi:leucyl aminopeptidase [Ectothiorhodospiraceae bacterium BW-2]|nr:leucyl aminopeptidase [Ectothiorhodospiraceae bacterium BW-2]